jgi:hypothetical protein
VCFLVVQTDQFRSAAAHDAADCAGRFGTSLCNLADVRVLFLWLTPRHAIQNGIDTINFRTLRESRSLDLDNQIVAVAGSKKAGDDDSTDVVVADPFDGFTSVTLHHDGDS